MNKDASAIIHSRHSTATGELEPGDVVIVWEHPELINSTSQFWWMGEVVRVERSTHRQKRADRLQVADIDTGALDWVNEDSVQKVLIPVRSAFSKVVQLQSQNAINRSIK